MSIPPLHRSGALYLSWIGGLCGAVILLLADVLPFAVSFATPASFLTCIVELEISENRSYFERVGKIRIARRPLLFAMGAHGIDIGAVEKRLAGIGIIASDPINQVVLPHH